MERQEQKINQPMTADKWNMLYQPGTEVVHLGRMLETYRTEEPAFTDVDGVARVVVVNQANNVGRYEKFLLMCLNWLAPVVPRPLPIEQVELNEFFGGADTAPEILDRAREAIANRAAERDQGSERSMRRCVDAFNAMTQHTLSERDGWLFMVMLKMARAQQGALKVDDYVDGAAYVALMGEAAIADSDAPPCDFAPEGATETALSPAPADAGNPPSPPLRRPAPARETGPSAVSQGGAFGFYRDEDLPGPQPQRQR